MSEIFNGLYDDVFLQAIDNSYDNEKINNITKKFLEGTASSSEKRYFLQLKNNYLKIKNIEDYDMLEKKLYDGKSRKEIISFEIVRILNKAKTNVKVLTQLEDIKLLLNMFNDDLPLELYNKIVELIIKIEISLGIKIGLFNELCDLFEEQLEVIDKKYKEELIIVKKK